jgi:flagellar hook-basal body complex protein FliE
MTTIAGISSQIPLSVTKSDSQPVGTAEKNFSDYLSSTIDQAVNAEHSSDAAVEKLSAGKAQNMHQVMLAVEEADISLRMLVQIRNKALQAYDDIMRMQI